MIVFDVGANDGSAYLNSAKNDPSMHVYAFEPQRNFYEALKQRTIDFPNYNVYPVAVSDFNGQGSFHICPDNGCSSLKPFSPKVDEVWDIANPNWGYKRVAEDQTYRSFYYTSSDTVCVITLDLFCKLHDISCIDFLHIDAQGSDLDVLRGMGESLKIVCAGEMEVAASVDKALYSGNHTRIESIAFLEEKGFKILDVWSNDPMGCEENIRFER